MPATQEDIQWLIEGCKRNDRKFQELFYNRFYGAMARPCLRYTKDPRDGMQVVNDGFLKAFKGIGDYDPAKGTVYTWIRTLMIHMAIDFLRKRPLGFTHDLPSTSEELAVSNRAMENMDAAELLEQIKKLPAATQLVFNLYAVDGYAHGEISEMLSISEGTSRWHVSDARKKLKEWLTTNSLKH